jgi:transposase
MGLVAGIVAAQLAAPYRVESATGKQRSSGGKSNLGTITKRGDTYLRTLLIQGAKSVVNKDETKRSARDKCGQEPQSNARCLIVIGCRSGLLHVMANV